MKGIITVIGQDRVGIIAEISWLLKETNVNILDISQTIMQEYFTMIMLVSLEEMNLPLEELQNKLNIKGDALGVSVKLQHEDIFKLMHRI